MESLFVFSLYIIHKIKNKPSDSSLQMFVLSYFLSCGKKSVFNLTLLQLLFDFHINGFYTILKYIFWKSLLALAQNKRTFNEKEKPDSHLYMGKSKVVLLTMSRINTRNILATSHKLSRGRKYLPQFFFASNQNIWQEFSEHDFYHVQMQICLFVQIMLSYKAPSSRSLFVSFIRSSGSQNIHACVRS